MFRRVLSSTLAPTIIIAAGLIAFFWLKSQDAPPARTQVAPSAPVVETISFEPTSASFEIRVGGNVVPSREVTISAQVEGVIVAKSADLEGGRYVAKGTSLLQIDPASYELAVQVLANESKQVEEDLRQVEVESVGNAALVKIAESKMTLATLELNRVKDLFDNKAVAETEYEAAQTFELEASHALQVLRNIRDQFPIRRERLGAELKLTDLRRQQAQLSLDRASVTAPFDGIITNDAIEVGDFVQAGDVLLEVEETASVEVECNLRTDDLYWLWNAQLPDGNDHAHQTAFEVPGVSATVTYTVGGRDFRWQGTLARYEGRGVDRTTRTIPCRVTVSQSKRDVDDGPPSLMRGMYVSVSLLVTPRVELWQLPNRAVQPNGQVWTINDDVLRIHQVEPARVLPDSVLIRADATDLKPGDRIIVSQLATPFDGMQVRQSELAERSP